MKNMRFEVRCPALWSEIDTFEEPMYEEVVKIVKGVGYCNSPSSAERLRNFGYVIKDLYLEKEKEKDDKQRGKDTSVSKGNSKSDTKNKGKQQGKAKASK